MVGWPCSLMQAPICWAAGTPARPNGTVAAKENIHSLHEHLRGLRARGKQQGKGKTQTLPDIFTEGYQGELFYILKTKSNFTELLIYILFFKSSYNNDIRVNF